MVLTPQVEILVRPEAKVRHLALHDDNAVLAWSEGQNRVCIARFSATGDLEMTGVLNHQHTVSCLQFLDRWLLVGDDLEGLVAVEHDGTLAASVEVDGGVAAGLVADGCLFGLSGMGGLVRWDGHGALQRLGERLGLEEVIDLATHGKRLYVACQNGDVVAVENNEVVWRRPARGVHGERITALGTTSSGALFLTREGHALVAGEEEAIEFELWKNDQLLLRNDLRMRLLTSCLAPEGALLGFDDGRVALLHEDGRFEDVMHTNHPVLRCGSHQGHHVASSWFYVHGQGPDGEWLVEHQGMPGNLVIRRDSGQVVFAGDDQNDYTAPEPIGTFCLEDPKEEADQAELSLWFEDASVTPAPSAEVLYGQPDDMLEHLTEGERATYGLEQPDLAGEHDMLLRAMGEAMDEFSDEGTIATQDPSTLLDQLQLDDALLNEEPDSLLLTLNEGIVSVERPQAFAGEDQRLLAEADGSALVLLDGRGTRDPHGMVEGWSWLNQRGVELATTPQLKLKLPIGRHAFELRVVDREGAWTTDGVVVEVVSSPTS